MKGRIIVTWSIVRVLMKSLKKIETTEAVEKFKTKRKVSATDRNAYSWYMFIPEHHVDDFVCDGCFVSSCSLNLWRIR